MPQFILFSSIAYECLKCLFYYHLFFKTRIEAHIPYAETPSLWHSLPLRLKVFLSFHIHFYLHPLHLSAILDLFLYYIHIYHTLYILQKNKNKNKSNNQPKNYIILVLLFLLFKPTLSEGVIVVRVVVWGVFCGQQTIGAVPAKPHVCGRSCCVWRFCRAIGQSRSRRQIPVCLVDSSVQKSPKTNKIITVFLKLTPIVITFKHI